MDLVRNLNYSADEINDILASVETKASKSKIEGLEQDLANTINLFTDYRTQKDEEINQLSTKVDDLDGNLTTLSENFNTKVEEYTGKFEEIDTAIEGINSDITNINSDIKEINGSITTINNTLSEHTTSIADNANEITTAKGRLDTTEKDIQDIKDTLAIPKTSLADYGILDAKIEEGMITLGEQSITPITEHQDISGKADVATTLEGYGILDAKIENGTITLGTNSIIPLVADDIVGKAESSKVQELEQKISDLEDKLNAAIVRIAALEGTTPQEPGKDMGESNPQPGEEQTPTLTENGEGAI